jgi:glycosyltransferase involved in cell wall biosynthesis
VLVLGLRGVVGVQGGIETHARRLYPLLARLGCVVEIVQRSPYFDLTKRNRSWHGVRLSYLWSPKRQGLETAVHTLLGVIYAAIVRPDVLHLHAVGPGLMAPLARLLGLQVVFTFHAPDYERDKFSRLQKFLLRLGEKFGVRFANHTIAISNVLKTDLQNRFGRKIIYIPNGAPRSVPATTAHALDRFGLCAGRYILCVGRLDPVKRHADIIEAFEFADTPDWKLVLVGGLDPQDPYCRLIMEHAEENPAIVLTNFQTGLALRELYSHAGLFVLASSTEGLPIALLEALSYGIPVAASAIPANLALPIPRNLFFELGNVRQIAAAFQRVVASPRSDDAGADRARILEEYSWPKAAHKTRQVYEQLVADEPGRISSERNEPWQKLS